MIGFVISTMLAAGATDAAQPLNLTCYGGGTAQKSRASSTYATNSRGESVWGTTTTRREVGFADQVDLRLFSGDDRIRLPRTMLPLARGGDDGWFKLKNIEVSERDITASAAVNFINNPKIRIDRLTGNINIAGKAGDYVGECRKVDPDYDKPRLRTH
jgi:hypothetical protein